MNILPSACLAILATTSASSAAVIRQTSFENETLGSLYVDTSDPNIEHALVNNPGQSIVNSTVTTELGYNAIFEPIRDPSIGLSNGGPVGVVSNPAPPQPFTDGSQGYQISNTNGGFFLNFETISLAGVENPTLSFDFFLTETNWTLDDAIAITISDPVNFVSIEVIPDTFLTGTDIDDLLFNGLDAEGQWHSASIDLSSLAFAELQVFLDTDTTNKALFLDNVVFKSNPIPEPSTLALLSGLLLTSVVRRRH
ncbi:MAG: PEP-CTERM sorting domain-containing protein [Verrucomicrobiota bacterium]